MVLGAAFGCEPRTVAGWPWKQVYHAWSAWQRKERRELRIRMMLAHQSSGLGMVGAGGPAPKSAPVSDGEHDASGALNARGLARAASMGIPVKRVKAVED